MVEQLLGIELSAIAQTIDPQSPTGTDPRLDTSPLSTYYQLKDVRNSARAEERLALVDNEPLSSFAHLWRPILEQVPQLLSTTYKDLELVTWLIEALTRHHGFRGISVGFELATTLIEHHWSQLYPMPDEEGLASRLAALVGLNGVEGQGTLLFPIASIPLTEEVDEQTYCLWQYQQGLALERLEPSKREQKHQAGGIALEHVQHAAKSSGAEFYQQLEADILAAIQSFQQFSAALDLAAQTPQPSSQINKQLHECLDAVRYLAAEKLVNKRAINQFNEANSDSETKSLAVGSAKKTEAAMTSITAFTALSLNNRQQAIEQLEAIATFFKQTEPHSPMAYGIEQVIRWSDMSLPDLLQELIADNDARAGYFRLTGIAAQEN